MVQYIQNRTSLLLNKIQIDKFVSITRKGRKKHNVFNIKLMMQTTSKGSLQRYEFGTHL